MWTLKFTEQFGWPGFATVEHVKTFKKIDQNDPAKATREALAYLSKIKVTGVATEFSLSWVIAENNDNKDFENQLKKALLKR